LEAKITISYKNKKEAEAVAKAVSPDNLKLPRGLFVKTISKESKVFTMIKCETKLQTFMATIDDLLGCVSVAEKVLSISKE